jgi:hypothetical protein
MKIWMLLMTLCSLLVAACHQKQDEKNPSLLPEAIASQALIERTIPDERVRRFVYPRRIIWQSPNSEHAQIEGNEHLIETKATQVMLTNDACCMMHNEGESPGILIDFGVELHGGIQVMVGIMGNKDPVRFWVRLSRIFASREE